MASNRQLPSTLLLSCCLIASILIAADAGGGGEGGCAAAGGGGNWKPIYNVNTPEIQKMARFAVSEHNSNTGSSYEYLMVLKAEIPLGGGPSCGGSGYRLVLMVKESRYVVRNVQVIVYSSGSGHMHLYSWKVLPYY